MKDWNRLREEPGSIGDWARAALQEEHWPEPPPEVEDAIWASLSLALPLPLPLSTPGSCGNAGAAGGTNAAPSVASSAQLSGPGPAASGISGTTSAAASGSGTTSAAAGSSAIANAGAGSSAVAGASVGPAAIAGAGAGSSAVAGASVGPTAIAGAGAGSSAVAGASVGPAAMAGAGLSGTSAGIKLGSVLLKLAALSGTSKALAVSTVALGTGIGAWGLLESSPHPSSLAGGASVVVSGATARGSSAEGSKPLGSNRNRAPTGNASVASADALNGSANGAQQPPLPTPPRMPQRAKSQTSGEPLDSIAIEASPAPENPRRLATARRAGDAQWLPARQLRSATESEPTVVPRAGLIEESSLLSQARAALRRGDFAETTRQLDAHRVRFAAGRLSQERQALRIELLWNSGSQRAARRLLRVYAEQYPGSPHASRLKALVDLPPSMPISR